MTIKFESMNMFQYTAAYDGKLDINAAVKIGDDRFEIKDVLLPPELTSAIFQIIEQEAEKRMAAPHAK